MAAWDDEESDSTPPTSPPQIAARRGKFDDEEDDSDVLESWDAAEDSDVEKEKAKKAVEAKAKADAEAAKNKKSKAQRVEEHRNERLRQKQLEEDDESSEDEDEAEKRAKLRKQEKDGDLKHAEDLFGTIGISDKRAASKPVNVADPSDANNTIDLSTLGIFNPETKTQFTKLGDTLTPLVAANHNKGHYVLFLQDFVKGLCKDLPSDQVKKVSSVLTTLANEKMKEEKAAEKGGKKSKAAKTKVALAATRDISYKADTTVYDEDGLDDGDFM